MKIKAEKRYEHTVPSSNIEIVRNAHKQADDLGVRKSGSSIRDQTERLGEVICILVDQVPHMSFQFMKYDLNRPQSR